MTRYRIRICAQDDPCNPRTENENIGTMACWHRRYTLGDEQPDVSPAAHTYALARDVDATLPEWDDATDADAQRAQEVFDALYANVMVLAQCSEELRYRASDVFYEGRTAQAEVERAVRERMAAVTDRVVRAIALQPMAAAGTDDCIERCVSRAEAALARSGNALGDVRDALTLFGEGEGDIELAQRSGRKISRARRENLKAALDGVRSAMERLQSVLEEEPDPQDAAEDDEDEAMEEGKAADEAVGSAARALLDRASGVLATRGVSVARGNSSDDAVSGEQPAEAELDAAAEQLLVERMAHLGGRLDGIISGGSRRSEPEQPAPAASRTDARAAELAKRASRIPGVRLPQHART